MGASSSAINPTQDFSPRMGGGRLFDMDASTVKYSGSSKILFQQDSRIYKVIVGLHTGPA